MDRFPATEVALPPNAVANEFERADLIFYGVEHRGPSFEARIFLNAPEADMSTPLELEDGYAGSFTVFGHGGCFGDEGHCRVPGERDPFDKRPPHGLTPLTKLVEITSALKHPRSSGESVSVSVVPVVPRHDGARQADVLFFTGMRLVTYR